MEAAKKEDVMKVANSEDPIWFAEVDSQNTTIYAQFSGVDPNNVLVEVNARETVFYPKKAFVNYITIKGFTMCHAATNWAPPTAGQKGLIGTHWSKGWIIENNEITYSKCSGVSLGKYGDEWDNKAESAEGYVGTINRALANKWNKENIGSHIVRNNIIAFCEQTGIVGSMGCAFSTISGNTIHDIHMKKLFGGAEMAGIKFHGAIDVQIIGNKIYRSDRGVWLDWMAQGAVVADNLMYENPEQDLFLEVDHGPMMVYNNIFLSKENLYMNSSGALFAHNLFGGKFNVIQGEERKTPYHKAHSTEIVDIVDNRSGDIRFINNLFVNGGSSKGYDKAELEMVFKGNLYLKGSEMSVFDKKNSFKPNFDANVKLLSEKKGMFLEINLEKSSTDEDNRTLVSTDNLGKAIVPNLPFENPNKTKLVINKDYSGINRSITNPSPGPFEIKVSGAQKIKVF
jgi:alpha-N-arabinofuranosidase